MTTSRKIKTPPDTLDLRIRLAEEVFVDRSLMVIGPAAYDEFLNRLNRPGQPQEPLRRTMRSKAPWHTG